MADDAKLLAIVEYNTKQVENALRRIESQTDRTFGRADRSIKRIDNSLKASAASAAKFGRSFGLAFSGAAAVAIAAETIRTFIRNTIESEAAVAQLNAALKSTGGAAGLSSKQLQDLATKLQGVSVFSDEAIIGAESLLLTFTKIGGKILPDAIATVLDMSTALGTDLKSSSIQVGKALQDPVKGITALSRVGVNFSKSQKTIIADLVKTGQLSKAQAIILKELQTEFGGSAQAARDTLGGALKALSEAWGDLFEVSGPASNQLRLAIEQLITSITAPEFKEAVAVIGTDLLNALKDIIDLAPQFTQRLRGIHQDVADFGAGLSDFRQSVDGIAEQIGRDSGLSKLSDMLGIGDEDLARIARGHEAVQRHATDLELLAALQKKFTIAPETTPEAPGGGGVSFVDPDNLAEETAAIDAEAAAIDAANEAAKEAARERKRTAADIVRQKEAVKELLSDLEFENSLIGLSNEQRETEIALRRAGAVATETQRTQITSLIAAGNAEQKSLDQLIDRMDTLRSAASSSLDSFVQALANGEGATAGLKAALVDVLQTIIRIGEQQAIASLFGAIGTPGGGALGGIIGGLLGGGAQTAAATASTAPRLATPSVVRLTQSGLGGAQRNGGRQIVDVRISAAPSPSLVLGWDQKARNAEDRAINRAPAVARDNSRRYATP